MSLSLADTLALQPVEAQRKFLNSLSQRELAALPFRWDFNGRPEQFEPAGNWSIWVVCCGRGYGKTRLGSEWVRSQMCGATPLAPGKCRRMAIIGETAKDLREVIARGTSGVLAVHPPEFRPTYTEKGGFVWPNGATALLYNGTEPDQLRGPNFDGAWCDELAKYRYAEETWDMLQFALRIGTNPRQLVTTTPRPIPILKRIMARPDTYVTRGSLSENRGNLAASYVKAIVNTYAGSRLGRQEIDGEVIDDVEGALWNRALIEKCRVVDPGREFWRKTYIGLDPQVGKDRDQTGIIAVSLGLDGHGYVRADASGNLSPEGWGRRVSDLYEELDADIVVAEVNQGGEMVRNVMRNINPRMVVQTVHARVGKQARAEPVSALYEQGRVHHVGAFPALEDQMATWESVTGRASPDRLDALVWAILKLMVRPVTAKPIASPQQVALRMPYTP